MTIELVKQSYVLAQWFAENEAGDDFMMCVYKKDKLDLNFVGKYRFRYRKDDKIFDSEDKKVWYTINFFNEAEQLILMKMDYFINNLIAAKFKKVDKSIVQGDTAKWIELAKKTTWCNMKEEKISNL